MFRIAGSDVHDRTVSTSRITGIRTHVEALLGPYRGFLHADGYSGFTKFYKPTTPAGDAPLVEVACWSHSRRYFFDVRHKTASPTAFEALQRIVALFAIESRNRAAPASLTKIRVLSIVNFQLLADMGRMNGE